MINCSTVQYRIKVQYILKWGNVTPDNITISKDGYNFSKPFNTVKVDINSQVAVSFLGYYTSCQL